MNRIARAAAASSIIMLCAGLSLGEERVYDFKDLVLAVNANDAATIAAIAKRNSFLFLAADEQGRTPLHLAAHADKRTAAEALLVAGADFYARDDNGQLPLDIAPGQTLNETRKFLREINKSRNAFLGAVHEQKLDQVGDMLAKDPTLARARDIGDGWTPVMTAAHHKNPELLKILLNAGAPVYGADFNTGFDAVYVAAEKGSAECLKLLVDAKANVRATWRVPYGSLPMQMNALHVACWKGHADVVDELLKAGVDVNGRAASYAVFSPLHFAATEGHAGIVKRLLAAGADRSAIDGRRGITALQMAEAGKHAAVVELLKPAP